MKPAKRKKGSGVVMFVLGLLSVLYLLNPGMGVFDLIPDNLPIVGNLDEAAATALLLSCLAYFGLDLTRIFRRAGQKVAAEDDDESVIDVEAEETK